MQSTSAWNSATELIGLTFTNWPSGDFKMWGDLQMSYSFYAL
jgi:hypothetical protein